MKKKLHPCLVPYEQLSEEEKTYDRNTCVQSFKYIIKAGFSIVPNPQ
jgi:ryanodine receptor 2